MATLLEDREAYDLADQAGEHIDGNPAVALRLVDRAIGRQPRESLFHGVRGAILASQGRHGEALRSYDAAVERNADYFAHYLGRGRSHDALGELRLARSDLTRSNTLLPTPIANYKLGGYALADGERAEAKRLFDGRERGFGRAWVRRARRLRPSGRRGRAPGRYLEAKPFFEDGQVVVEVSNTSDYRLADIVVRVHVEINGESFYRRLTLQRLRSGYYDVLESGIRYREEDEVRAETLVLEAGPGW